MMVVIIGLPLSYLEMKLVLVCQKLYMGWDQESYKETKECLITKRELESKDWRRLTNFTKRSQIMTAMLMTGQDASSLNSQTGDISIYDNPNN